MSGSLFQGENTEVHGAGLRVYLNFVDFVPGFIPRIVAPRPLGRSGAESLGREILGDSGGCRNRQPGSWHLVAVPTLAVNLGGLVKSLATSKMAPGSFR